MLNLPFYSSEWRGCLSYKRIQEQITESQSALAATDTVSAPHVTGRRGTHGARLVWLLWVSARTRAAPTSPPRLWHWAPLSAGRREAGAWHLLETSFLFGKREPTFPGSATCIAQSYK